MKKLYLVICVVAIGFGGFFAGIRYQEMQRPPSFSPPAQNGHFAVSEAHADVLCTTCTETVSSALSKCQNVGGLYGDNLKWWQGGCQIFANYMTPCVGQKLQK